MTMTHVASSLPQCTPEEIRTNIVGVLAADEVLMPENWWRSYGASLERQVALAIGTPISYAGSHDDPEEDQ